jgi:hypothetical protein
MSIVAWNAHMHASLAMCHGTAHGQWLCAMARKLLLGKQYQLT